jgi:putative membrane protein
MMWGSRAGAWGQVVVPVALASRPGGGKGDETDASGQTGTSRPAQPPGETEPDARYTFANERTFLAWIRTALALVAAGLAIVQLLPPFPGLHWGRPAIGIPLIVLGGLIAVLGYLEWTANQRALRRREPLRRSRLPLLLAVVVALVAVVAAVVAVMSQ